MTRPPIVVPDDGPRLALTLPGGGDAAIVLLEGERTIVDSSQARAPGTRMEAKVDDGPTIRIKVHRCVKQDDRFLIEGRFIDLTRGLRRDIEKALGIDA